MISRVAGQLQRRPAGKQAHPNLPPAVSVGGEGYRLAIRGYGWKLFESSEIGKAVDANRLWS